MANRIRETKGCACNYPTHFELDNQEEEEEEEEEETFRRWRH